MTTHTSCKAPKGKRSLDASPNQLVHDARVVPNRTRGPTAIVALVAGVMIGSGVRYAEGNAEASEVYCDTGELSYDFESFRRVSGTGSEAIEVLHWQAVAQLLPVDPALGLAPDDESGGISFALVRLP